MKNVVTLTLAGKVVFATNVSFNDTASGMYRRFFKVSPAGCRELQNTYFNLDHVSSMEEVKYLRNLNYQEDTGLDEEYGDALNIKLTDGRVIKLYDMTLDTFQAFLAGKHRRLICTIGGTKMKDFTKKGNAAMTKINAYTAKHIGMLGDAIYQKLGKEQKAELWLNLCKYAGILPANTTIDWSIDETDDKVKEFYTYALFAIKNGDINDVDFFKNNVLNGMEGKKHIVLNAYTATMFLKAMEIIYNKMSEKQKAEGWLIVAKISNDVPEDAVIDWEDTTVSTFDKMYVTSYMKEFNNMNIDVTSGYTIARSANIIKEKAAKRMARVME